MITGAVEEDLRLVFEPAEGAAVDDAVAVPLELGAPGRRVSPLSWAKGARNWRSRASSSARVTGMPRA
jgi:hypothetical protein